MLVWVSGARGKLGAAVCEQLRTEGHEVIEADIRGGERTVDLLDRRAVAESLRDADAIVHCAGIPSPENVIPADLVATNTMSTFNALEEAWQAGIRLAVLASSGSIYGTAWAPEPLTPPLRPRGRGQPAAVRRSVRADQGPHGADGPDVRPARHDGHRPPVPLDPDHGRGA
ncbi:MAG: NAD-dependent epimerase/dehydratase family protein [Blastococcus sp.]